MPPNDSVLCPECGWSGPADDLTDADGAARCPVCAEAVEIVDG